MDDHILLVEDEAEIASFIQRGLTEEDYVVTWATTGEQALTQLNAAAIDAVLLDIRLPGMSGLDMLEQVRAHDKRLPVMMLTALDAVEDRVRGLRSGADDYLPKPFDFEELLARIEALLRRAEQGRLLPPILMRSCRSEPSRWIGLPIPAPVTARRST